MEGLKDKRIELPGIKADKTLPVVLSKQEVKRLLIAPKLLKHRVLLAFTAAACAASRPATFAYRTWTLNARCSTSG